MSDIVGWLGGMAHAAGGALEVHAGEHATGALGTASKAAPWVGGALGLLESGIGAYDALTANGATEEGHREQVQGAGDGAWGLLSAIGGFLGPEVAIPMGLASLGSQALFGVGPGAATANVLDGRLPGGGERPSLDFAPTGVPMTVKPPTDYTLPDRETQLMQISDPNSPFMKGY